MSCRPALASLAVLAACGPRDPVDTLLGCPDAACRSAALRSAWEADAPRVEAWLSALPDADGQSLLAEQLALAEPDAAARICDQLPVAGRARERCAARVIRPHLDPEAGPRPPRSEAAAGSGPGPRGVDLPVLDLPPPPWLAATPAEYGLVLRGCDEDQILCARFAARAQAEAGDPSGAGLACLAGDPALGDDYAECLFQAAEAMAEALGAEGIGPALELCARSTFGPMCVAHVLTLVGPRVPAADALVEEDLAGPLAVVAALGAASADQPRIQASYVDRYWSSWTATTWRWAERVDGRLLPLLPREARPHVAVAVAARLLREHDPGSLEFEPFVTELRAALADPGQRPWQDPRRKRHRLTTQHTRQLWPADRDEQRSLPAAWVMGPGRRALAVDDPEADLRIAQLRDPPPASFFLVLVGDPAQHRLVRWTAARLGALLDPDAARALTDRDPLVQAALDGTHGRGRSDP